MRITIKKFLNLIVLPVLLALFITGCTQKRDTQKNMIIAHLPSEPPTLHPTNGTSGYRRVIFEYIHKRLIRTDIRTPGGMNTIPQLVKKMPEISPGGLQYTFELKKGPRWDDGSPLKLEDVIFSVKMNICPLTDNPRLKPYFAHIENIKQYPDHPRKFTMVCKDKYFANQFLFELVWMMQKDHWDPSGVMDEFSIQQLRSPDFDSREYPDLVDFMKKFNDASNGRDPGKIVGLGPYQVTQWNVGRSIVVEKKENWWGEDDTLLYNQNFPEKIIFKIIRDDASLSLALKKESIDVSAFLDVDELLKLKEKEYFNKNYHSDFVKSYVYTYIALNMKPDGVHNKPLFVDRDVRRAIAHLIPVKQIIDVIYQGKAIRQVSIVPSLKPSYNDTLAPVPFDIEKARKLLTRAGWEDSDGDNIRDKIVNNEQVEFKFQLNYFNKSKYKAMSRMIKDAMKQAGIEMSLNAMDFSLLIKKAHDHHFDAMIGAWSASAGPEDPRQIWHTESWANKSSNYTGFGNSRTDSLIELANRTMDLDKRMDIIKKIQAIVYHEQPYVFLFSNYRSVAVHNRFMNIRTFSDRPWILLNTLKLKGDKGDKNKVFATKK